MCLYNTVVLFDARLLLNRFRRVRLKTMPFRCTSFIHSFIHFTCIRHFAFSPRMYRSPVKEWQVSWFVLGTVTLNDTYTVVCKYCRTVRTKCLHISIKSFYCSVCAIQNYCPQNKPADLPLFYWRPVRTVQSLPETLPAISIASYNSIYLWWYAIFKHIRELDLIKTLMHRQINC